MPLHPRWIRSILPALVVSGVALLAHGAATDIASGPLAQPATSVKPNLLLILDDSGSMARQYTPDYLGLPNCMDSLDFSSPPGSNPRDCHPGDPPAMSADFNTQYYNPRIRYFPAVNYDGSTRGDMNAAATANWTAVPTDNVSSASSNESRKGLVGGSLNAVPLYTHWGQISPGSPLLTYNLTTGFPDRVWCNSTAASATDVAACKTNSAYTYPDNVFGYGLDGAGNRKYKYGAPYYYQILATEFCADLALTNCVAASTPTVVGGVTFDKPAPVRFCDSAALTTCQAKRSGAFVYPKFLGQVNPGTPGFPGVRARGRIIITEGDAGAPTINQITITTPGGTTVNLFGSPLTTVATNSDANRLAAATTIRNHINLNSGGHGYLATLGVNNNTANTTEILIDAPTASVSDNGSTISVNAPATGPTTPASLSFRVSNTNSKTDSVISIGLGPAGGPTTALISSAIGGYSNNIHMAAAIHNSINVNTSSHGYVATSSGTTVWITAPAGTGSERNGWPLTFSHVGLADVTASLAGGITPGDLAYSTVNFTGGVDSIPGASWSRQSVGTFVRTDIRPGQSYNKYPARSDCAGTTTCSYDEEMTNFANWFAYYRTRMQMAKTAIGRAFVTLGSDYRVGFKTINFSSTRYLAVGDFTTTAGGQKQSWYASLYGSTASGSTPLRSALARAGRYYGNQNPEGTMGASPIQLSCQPSYTILTTDGYWNDSTGFVQLNGSTRVGDQDGVNAGYSTRAIGAFDALGASNTLADVALYYYKTDLRPDLANQVPASQRDNASHQRMVTFTVGLGLAGTLQYDPNYETQTSGDFFDIKQGSKSWPIPTWEAETTLDDLWHAAVNGRGTFFSAQDPVALANGIAETLAAVQARVGAGAAAATSNLQPVAGDNFAFTAQYETVSWTGDLRARTIDLSTGTVSTRELWSAQALLDQRAHTTRRIFAFDAADTVPGATVTVAGVSRTQNGNRLRSFCPPDTPAASNPNCNDGGLLNASEMGTHFDPLGGANGALLQAVTWPTDGSLRHLTATGDSLVNYLRGDTNNEMASPAATSLTDLYRNRSHLLGDIVNAQPAYVKVPPFSYSDPFYADFKASNASRIGTVFAAANDGMLHAFETDPDNNPYFQNAGIGTASTSDDTFTGTLSTDPVSGEGSERWAYIPSMVFPTLKRLAESNYATNHRYLTDGSPVVGDVCFGHTTATPCASASNWKTVLVAGLNAGGRGFYALDITDPANPRGLWELKGGSGTACLSDAQANSGSFGEDCNIGLSFGNPLIVKRPGDGRWVALLTSGHNNISPGNGRGYLYVVDIQTGLILQRLGTGVGCDGVSTTAPCSAGNVDPSGLSRINAWANSPAQNNTALSVYGGDLKGNLWRFQLEDTAAVPAGTVTRLTTLVNAAGTAQPVTTRPELALIGNSRVVYTATGSLLGSSDRNNADRQSVYAIKDPMTGTSAPVYAAIRSDSGFVEQTLSLKAGETDRRTTTSNTVNLLTDRGWYVDLPDGGSGSPSERVSVDPLLQLGTLAVPSNIPSDDECVAGGYGWVNFMDARTGSYIPGATDNVSGRRIGASLIVGVNVVQLPGGTVKTIVTSADNQQITQDTPVAPTTTQGRRVSWRELFVD